MKIFAVAVAALAALPLSSKAQSVGDLRLLSELPPAVRRYGANAEVTFKVVDTDGKPVEGVSVCGVILIPPASRSIAASSSTGSCKSRLVARHLFAHRGANRVFRAFGRQ